MEIFLDYLDKIENLQHRTMTEEILSWVMDEYPKLQPRIAWNQPMFTNDGTFIIAFSVSKKHLAVAPERVVINRFTEDIIKAGYGYSKELIRIKWDDKVDYSLLARLIEFNIVDKANCSTFWRKKQNSVT